MISFEIRYHSLRKASHKTSCVLHLCLETVVFNMDKRFSIIKEASPLLSTFVAYLSTPIKTSICDKVKFCTKIKSPSLRPLGPSFKTL